MRALRIVMLAAATLLCAAFASQIPGCVTSNAPKKGTVIDVDTGNGLANVAVIASAHFYADGLLGGAASNYAYRLVTRTDAQGQFSFPAVWWAPRLALPGTHAREDWLVTALKPGYALIGDEVAWSAFDSHGGPKYFPPSVALSPEGTFDGLTVNVAPLRMRRVKLSLQEFATYYAHVRILGDPPHAADEELRHEVSAFLTPMVCAIARSEVLGRELTAAIMVFATDQAAVESAFRDAVLQQVRDGTYDSATYSAGQVCDVMQTK